MNSLDFVLRYSILRDFSQYTVGADCGEGPPVPIPNTEVKLTCVDNTWWATAREDRKVPTYMQL